jgi:hypothetical protein
MTHRVRLWPRFASALILALAVGVAWGFVAVWIGYLASQLWWSSPSVSETIQVRSDGTPIISTYSYSYRTVYDQSFRTLDGQPLDLAGREEWLNGAYFVKTDAPRSLLQAPITWPERIASTSNFERPQTGWYLVRDDQTLGHAYMVGFDEASKLRIGYIGRNGFRLAEPARDEWFDVGRHRFTWGAGVVCSSGTMQFGARAYTWPVSAGDYNLPPWQLFLIDGNRLLEIDLRQRSVRTLLDLPGMLNIAIANEPLSPNGETNAAAGDRQETASDAAADEAATAATGSADRRGEPLPQRIAIQMADRIVILDPSTSSKREYVLPEKLRGHLMYTYPVNDNQLLVQWWRDETVLRRENELTWLKPDGSIAHEQSVSLNWPQQSSEQLQMWSFAAVAPVPLGWILLETVFAPIGLMQSNQADTYAAAVSHALSDSWPQFLVVVALGVILAWRTYRWQHVYRRPATGLWTTFVLLLGVPAFLAYWLENRKAKLESCTSCGEIVPRDRDACAACETQFPAPQPVGTEIFA